MLRPRRLGAAAFAGLLLATIPVFGVLAGEPDQTDPARNLALPCEIVNTPGLLARSNRNIEHVANVCGFVGTDVELQSRTDQLGRVHDYAFVGTMGAGFRIYDVTDPTNPIWAGGYVDSGWENDVQVRGDVVAATFDGVDGEDSSASTCLKTRYPDASGQGVDVYRLSYDPATAKFQTSLLGCVANPPGGAHNATLHPSGNWLGISNCCSDWAIDVVDLRPALDGGDPVHSYRLIDESHADAGRCPAGAAFTCVVMKRPDGSSARGLWQPHDVFFSENGRTAYVAAIQSTFVVDVGRVLSGKAKTISIIPNDDPNGTGSNDITISHQADTTADGKILIITDERGGGLTNTDCNESPDGIIGAMHFWALRELRGVPQSEGAKPSTPKKIGIFVNPNPPLGSDPIEPLLENRLERACTVHVFRVGGNGSVSPGEIEPGLGGVSTLAKRELTTAWYGAGVWHLDFSGPPRNDDGVVEDSRTTWGNTVGWNVMPGADTWSAKEYKGFIFAGDIARGFDVYGFAE